MKRSQIKMGETIAILVIFFFLLVFGYSFYAGVQQYGFKKQAARNLDLKAIQLALKASFLPELQCSIKNNPIDNCFDVDKIQALQSMMSADSSIKSHYLTMFGASELYVTEIYPGTATYIIFNASNENASAIVSTKIPVSLYYPTTGKFTFAVLMVKAYEK